MKTNTRYVIALIIGVILLLVAFVAINNEMNPSGPDLTQFAMCLKSSGTIFYGAFWCPHCAATKRMFGNAVSDLPYHECSTPDGSGQLQSCNDAGVQHYPTWVFPDGTRLEGETTLATLSARSGCPLPAGVDGGAVESSATSTGASSSSAVGGSASTSASTTNK